MFGLFLLLVDAHHPLLEVVVALGYRRRCLRFRNRKRKTTEKVEIGTEFYYQEIK